MGEGQWKGSAGMKDDIITELVDISLTGAKLAGAKIDQSAEEIVESWGARERRQTILRQEHSVFVIEETATEWVAARNYPEDMTPVHYSKSEWMEVPCQ
jgi:hypothetical protein